jgi:uncharacterized protein
MNPERAIDSLLNWFKDKGSVLVAFSGGVDSSVVAALAKMALGDKAMAVTAQSTTLPPWELREAKKIAKEIGIKHLITKVDELRDPSFAKNPPNRCYFCKRELIAELKRIANERGIRTIVDGTNASDLRSHRPGVLALEEEGIRSPLAELGVRKDEVREIAKHLGLTTAEKPSMACLASRFPYGFAITRERLKRVARAETFIRELTGVKQLRVRYHGDVARIEVGRNERELLLNEKVMDVIHEKLRSLGFRYVTLDLFGYRPITP